MDNETTITLTGGTALDYIRGQRQDEGMYEEYITNLAALRNIIEEKDERIERYIQEVSTLVEELKHYKSQEQAPSAKVARDTEIYKEPYTVVEEPEEVEDTPIKYKSRLSKKDKEELAILAGGKFRSGCMVANFAMKRNLRTKTVLTYIEKHSDGEFMTVLGGDIKSYEIWAGANIDPTRLYFTTSL